jgi:hypothetical protein
MKRLVLLFAMIPSMAWSEIPTQKIQPVFISVHISTNRVIKINTNQIRWFEDYYPPDDLYYGSHIYLIGSNGAISVIEKPDEIELMMSEVFEKPKPKGKK